MPFQLATNNALSTLSVAVTTNTQASLTLQTGHGARFPSPLNPDYCYVTLDDGTNVEVCKCIARATDVLTVLRGQENTVAQSAFATGTKVELRLTADSEDWIARYAVFQPAIMRAQSNVGSFQMMGMAAPTIVGSTISTTLMNSSWREANDRIRLNVADSAQQPCEIRLNTPMASGQSGFRFYTRFGFANVPNSSHFFIGLVGTTGQVASVFPPSSITNGIAIGFANGALGSDLSIWRSNSQGPATALDLGSYFTANTLAWYEFEVDVAPGDSNWYYRVRRLDCNSIADASSFFSTSLPSNSLWLSPMMHHTSMVNSRIAPELGGWAFA